MRTPPRRPDRRGFTLTELMVSLVLTSAVFAIAIPFYRVQTRTLGANGGRLDAQQNVRFAVNAIDRDLRVAGSGIVDAQPLVVQAEATALTFNVDLVTEDAADPTSVYYNQFATILGTIALPKSRRLKLPLTTRLYPDTDYVMTTANATGVALPSRAETISYWVSLDSTTTRTDDYIMWRRVNDLATTVVAKHLVVPAGQPLFRYFKTDSLGNLVEIPTASLPLYHSAAIHGSNADTAKSALTDSIRSVVVRVTGLYDDVYASNPANRTVLRAAQSSVRLLNTGLVRHATCGEPPFGTSTVATVITVGGNPAVRVTWSRSLDETSGEKDVERYAVFKKKTTDAGWGEPFASVPAGLASYVFIDTDVGSAPLVQWVYGVVVQDCTPAMSAISQSLPLIIP